MPCVNITGGYADISKLADYADEKINIGDTVTVIDCGNEIRERVIRLIILIKVTIPLYLSAG